MWKGRAKTGRWGQGAANSGRKEHTNVHELEERRRQRKEHDSTISVDE